MKILITGTGRAGTSFLVQVLTELGFDTGYGPKDCATEIEESSCKAGLEKCDLNSEVIKSPHMGADIKNTLRKFIPDLVIIPIREPKQTAKSREAQGDGNGGWNCDEKSVKSQMEHDGNMLHRLIYELANLGVSYIFLPYPKWILYPDTIYPYLKVILDEKGIDLMKWTSAVVKFRNEDWIHEYK
jgi:hypothetical protein